MAEVDRILLVGLGALGHLLVGHLAPVARERGVRLLVHDIDAEATARVAADTGAEAVPDVAAVPAGDRLLLVTCVPTAAVVESVVAAARDGGSIGSGSTVLDLSSVPPAFAEEYAARLAADGIAYLDAPLTGGIAAARTATMVTMAGGDRAALAAVEWVTRAFSERVVWTGASGTGALLKTINNWIGNTAAVAAMEGIVLLRAAGLENDAILEVLNDGPAATYFSMSRYPRYLADRDAPSGAPLGLVTKDLRIAVEAADRLGATPALSLLAEGLWRGAVTRYGKDGDMLRMLDHVSRTMLGRSWEDVDGR